jgi:hypothetical protein
VSHVSGADWNMWLGTRASSSLCVGRCAYAKLCACAGWDKMSGGARCCANASDGCEYSWSTNGVPLLPPPRLLVEGEMDIRCGCWGGGGGASAGPRLPVLAFVLDCSETGLSESRSRFADGLPIGRGRSPTDASS